MGNTDLRLKDTSQGKAEKLRSELLDPAEANRLARQAQALSDPTRLTLLLLLREAGKLCVSDLCLILERGQSAVSRHLKIALDAGLLSNYRFDLWTYYELTEDGKRLLAVLLDESD
jgi:DNA-binding transcriptional ArsR family regulator